MNPLPASVDALAVNVTDPVAQFELPPVTAGTVGPALSSLAVLAALLTADVHAETLPALSVARIWTIVVVVPLALTTAGALVIADHVAPLSVEVWY